MKHKLVAFLLGLSVLAGCSGQNMANYADTTPPADIKEFFTGPIKGWGVLQDWRGRVVSRFDVDIQGTWEGDTGRLDEYFTYYDGTTQTRIWHIEKTGENTYRGRADDILDEAAGETSGTAIRWAYQMDVPYGDSTIRLTFDDWMYQMNDGVLVNRSYLKKFGFTVAELTLFMQKQ